MSAGAEDLLEQLAELLAEALAPKLAARLAALDGNRENGEGWESARLVTLDELVAQLPRAKSATTWKRWLYERTRRGEVPGCRKLGGMLFFDREQVQAWLAGRSAAEAESGADRLDSQAKQSNDQAP